MRLELVTSASLNMSQSIELPLEDIMIQNDAIYYSNDTIFKVVSFEWC
jgi:hypothetical protein